MHPRIPRDITIIHYLFNELGKKLEDQLNDCQAEALPQVAEIRREVDELHHRFADLF